MELFKYLARNPHLTSAEVALFHHAAQIEDNAPLQIKSGQMEVWTGGPGRWYDLPVRTFYNLVPMNTVGEFHLNEPAPVVTEAGIVYHPTHTFLPPSSWRNKELERYEGQSQFTRLTLRGELKRPALIDEVSLSLAIGHDTWYGSEGSSRYHLLSKIGVTVKVKDSPQMRQPLWGRRFLVGTVESKVNVRSIDQRVELVKGLADRTLFRENKRNPIIQQGPFLTFHGNDYDLRGEITDFLLEAQGRRQN